MKQLYSNKDVKKKKNKGYRLGDELAYVNSKFVIMVRTLGEGRFASEKKISFRDTEECVRHSHRIINSEESSGLPHTESS